MKIYVAQLFMFNINPEYDNKKRTNQCKNKTKPKLKVVVMTISVD